MKKTYFVLFLLALVLAAVAALSPLGIPSQDDPYYGADLADGKKAVLENNLFLSRIYTVQEGEIVDLYEEFRIKNFEETLIGLVTPDGEAMCFLRRVRGAVSYPWQLVRLNNQKAEVLYEDNFANNGGFTGLAAQDGVYWLTFLGNDGSITVYEYTEQTKLQAKLVMPAGLVENIESAEFDGTQIRAVTEDGSVWRIKADQTAEELPGETQPQMMQLNAGASIGSWLLCKRIVFQALGLLWLTVSVLLLFTSYVSRYSKHIAMRLCVIGGVSLILSMMGAGLFQVVIVAGFVDLQSAYIMLWLGSFALLLYVLVFSLVLRVQIKKMTAPIPRLTEQMNEVSQGHINPVKVEPGRDELHRLSRAMQEMCLSLSIRDYDLRSTIRSYQRFVPMEMTKLMESGTVTELELGDSQRTEGFLGVVSIENHSAVRTGSDDSSFVKFINYNLRLLDSCVKENKGYLLSGDLRLDSMNTVFRTGAQAVHAALDFFGRTQLAQTEGVTPANPVCLIHKTSFLYGIAGWEERLFPYLSCAELEFLRGYAHHFNRAGVHIAVTGECWDAVREAGFCGRYIGYLQAKPASETGDAGVQYHIYEILDAYPKMEREVILGYDDRFQRALDLFYHNDFYLARSLFSELMKIFPDDGVVRWYVFTCEHYFHEESAKVCHQLFGNTIM